MTMTFVTDVCKIPQWITQADVVIVSLPTVSIYFFVNDVHARSTSFKTLYSHLVSYDQTKFIAEGNIQGSRQGLHIHTGTIASSPFIFVVKMCSEIIDLIV